MSKERDTLAEIKAKIASHDYSAELLLQHAMLLLERDEQAEPNDWRLPADLKAGHVTFRKGVHCSALVSRMKMLHETAFGVDNLTAEQKAENLAALQAGEPLPHDFSKPAAAEQAEPVDTVPLDYATGHADGLEWAACLVEMDDPRTGDWRYDDRGELAAAIRKGPEMPPSQPAAQGVGELPPLPAPWSAKDSVHCAACGRPANLANRTAPAGLYAFAQVAQFGCECGSTAFKAAISEGPSPAQFTAEQMRAYARAALAQAPAAVPLTDDAKDASRWRHLRDAGNDASGGLLMLVHAVSEPGDHFPRLTCEASDYDVAIDAAIAANSRPQA